jgi:hypothetical protein
VISGDSSTDLVERMFSYVPSAKILLIGRKSLRRKIGKLYFVLVTEDISETVRAEIL